MTSTSGRRQAIRWALPLWISAMTVGIFLGSPAAHAALGGLYKTPLGKVRITEKNGVVKATSVGRSKCGKKRRVVFEGTRLDDSITGTIHACKIGPGCKGKTSGMMMLLITRGGKTLSGAVHMNAGSCKTPIKGDGITISLLSKPGTTKKIKLKKRGRSATRRKAKQTASTTGVDTPDSTSKTPTAKSKVGQAEALAAEGGELLKLGKIEEAREKFTQAADLVPDYANAYQGIGVTYYLRGRYAEALGEYKRAIEADPSNGDTYYNMACVYALLEKKEQAFRYLSIAVINGFVGAEFSEDRDLKSLWDDPRWEQVKQGLPVQTSPEAAKEAGEIDDEKAAGGDEETAGDVGADSNAAPSATSDDAAARDSSASENAEDGAVPPPKKGDGEKPSTDGAETKGEDGAAE